MMKPAEPLVLKPPVVAGPGHHMRAAAVLPALDERQTSHLVVWESVEAYDSAAVEPGQRTFVCAYEKDGGAPFLTEEIAQGAESAALTSPHDSGAFAIGLDRRSGEWSVRKLVL